MSLKIPFVLRLSKDEWARFSRQETPFDKLRANGHQLFVL